EVESCQIVERQIGARAVIALLCPRIKEATRRRAGAGDEQEGNAMSQLTRRAFMRTSLATAAAGGLARPFIATAAATTATGWWTQGFVPEEDTTIEKIFADYQKASGNTLEHSLIPFAPQRQKIISAITSGVVPDLTTVTPTEAAALQAWAGTL